MLKSLMRYLSRVLEVKVLAKAPVTVVEKYVFEMVTIIQSPAFKKNPDVLDEQRLPKDVVTAQRYILGQRPDHRPYRQSNVRPAHPHHPSVD